MNGPRILSQTRIDSADDPRSSRTLTVFDDSVVYVAHGPAVRVESHLTYDEAHALARAILANVPAPVGSVS